MRHAEGQHPDIDHPDHVQQSIVAGALLKQHEAIVRIRRAYTLFRRTLESIQYSCEDTPGSRLRPMEKLAAAINEWLADLPVLPDENGTYELSNIMDDVRHLQPCLWDRAVADDQRMPLPQLAREVYAQDAAKIEAGEACFKALVGLGMYASLRLISVADVKSEEMRAAQDAIQKWRNAQ